MPSTCPRCDGILDLRFPEKPDAGLEAFDSGLWSWQRWLPTCAPEQRVTLGEGRSPLLACHRLGRELGLSDFFIKNDSGLPTGSFKDRAIALATSLARNYGRPGVVVSSSGNAGASAAAYAARAGLPAVVFVPANAPKNKLAEIRVHGVRLVIVRGETSDCCRLARLASERFGWVNLTTTFYNPYGVDAYATIAYEIAAVRPDYVLLPISSGPLLVGMMKGFARLQSLGRIDRIPRPVAVQSANCAPIVRALAMNKPVAAWTPEYTVATALNDTLAGYERDGDYTLAWIRRFQGTAVAVSDAAIIAAVGALAQREGIFVEPSAAAPVAAVSDLLAAKCPGGRVTTGHGLKDIPKAALGKAPKPIDALETELAHVFG
jgi:threonine synthase